MIDSQTPTEGQPLSPREISVMQMVSHGYSDQQVAEALGIAKSTATTLLRRGQIKLGAANRTEAACRALREGVIK